MLDLLKAPSLHHDFGHGYHPLDIPRLNIPWQDTSQRPPQYILNPEKALRNPVGMLCWSVFNRWNLISIGGSSIGGTMIPLDRLHERPLHEHQQVVGETQSPLNSPFMSMRAVPFGEGQASRQTEHSISGSGEGFRLLNTGDTTTFSTNVQETKSQMSHVKPKPLRFPRPSSPHQDGLVDMKRRQRGIV